jgi:hypothetical protein
MRLLLRDAITYLLALAARVLTPAFQRQLARLCVHLFNDVPLLDAAWVVHFHDPSPTDAFTPRTIDAQLNQFGRFITGNGHIQGEPGDPFQYRGVIKRNVLYGTFRRKDSHVLAGTGTFVLKISPNSRSMRGHCTWYDNDLEDVWISPYIWTRK